MSPFIYNSIVNAKIIWDHSAKKTFKSWIIDNDTLQKMAWGHSISLIYQTIKKLYILGSGYKSTKCFLGHWCHLSVVQWRKKWVPT